MAMAMALCTSSFPSCPPSITISAPIPLRPTRRRRWRTMHQAPRFAFRCATSQHPSPVERANALFLHDSRPIVLFDGVCNLCNGGVNIVLDNDPKGSLRLAALQSDAGRALLQRCGRSPSDISSIVLVEENRSSTKSEAVLRIANYLRAPFPLIAALLDPFPLFLKDTVYDAVAANRYTLFGKISECRLSDASYKDRFIEVAAFFLDIRILVDVALLFFLFTPISFLRQTKQLTQLAPRATTTYTQHTSSSLRIWDNKEAMQRGLSRVKSSNQHRRSWRVLKRAKLKEFIRG